MISLDPKTKRRLLEVTFFVMEIFIGLTIGYQMLVDSSTILSSCPASTPCLGMGSPQQEGLIALSGYAGIMYLLLFLVLMRYPWKVI